MRTKTGTGNIAFRPLSFTLAEASIAIFFGLNLGSIFAYKNQLMYVFLLTSYDIDSVVSVVLLGAAAGVICGGFISQGSGRKSGIVAGAVIGIAASCMAVLSRDFSSLLLSEFTVGAGFGIYIVSALLYAAEISLPVVRGMCCCMPAVGAFLGLLTSVAARIALPDSPIAIAALMASTGTALCLLCALWLPESPRWLVLAGYTDAALTSLFTLRSSQAAAAREMAFITDVAGSTERGMQLYLHSAASRRALRVLVVLVVLMHLSGFAIVPYMSLELIHRYKLQYLGILVMRNYDYSYGFVKAAVAVAFFGAATAMMASDRTGRPKAMLVGTAISLAMLALLSAVTLAGLSDLNVVFVSALILVYIFAAVFTTVAFLCVFACEILPSGGREAGLCLILAIHLLSFIAGIQDVGVMSPGFDLSPFFAALLAFCAVLCFVLAFRVPDPGIGSLERNETRLMEGRLFAPSRSGMST